MLRIANVFDQDLMALARQEATMILDADPDLTDPKHAGIVAERDRFLARFRTTSATDSPVMATEVFRGTARHPSDATSRKR